MSVFLAASEELKTVTTLPFFFLSFFFFFFFFLLPNIVPIANKAISQESLYFLEFKSGGGPKHIVVRLLPTAAGNQLCYIPPSPLIILW